MTKAELAAKLAVKIKLNTKQAEAVVNSIIKSINDALAAGDKVEIRGFGSFIVKKRAEKNGRNISQNIAVVIPAHNIPAFKPSKTFVNSVKQNVPIV